MFFKAFKNLAKASVVFLTICLPLITSGQQVEFSSAESVSLEELFQTIEEQTAVRFVFSEDEVELEATLILDKPVYELDELIEHASTQLGISFKRINDYYIVTNAQAGQGHEDKILQTVSGKVVDLETGAGLLAATIYAVEHPASSTTTDIDGNFSLQAPIGRLNLAISYMGYKTVTVPMLINTGEQPFITIRLEASIASLKEINIEAEGNKAQTQNELAYASGRGFTVLEANRYAGTLGDPARMARSYAGVLPARDDRNDIIIRGNSPVGIQWRLDDIEIPNPNHYGGIGLTGNTTTLLNINLLDNSDFLMGAFPSEYGNALAGVFDLHTKAINPNRRQYRFQTGWNGFELGAEGPFSKSNPFGTYSLTYRYSFLDVVDAIGIDFGVLPQFQDVTGKFDFKLGAKTDLSLLGIWGTSFIELDDRDFEDDESVTTGEYLKTGSDLALVGLNLKHRFNDHLLLKTGLSVIDNRVKTEVDTFNFASDASNRVFTDNSGETKYALFSQVDHRKGRNLFRVGFRWDTYDIDYKSSSIGDDGGSNTRHSSTDLLNLARLYIEDEYRFSDRLRARAGVHSQYFLFNESFAVEPRFALRYFVSPFSTLALSYGNHHMLQPRTVYFLETPTANGPELTNKDLDFSAAHHVTLAYDHTLSDNLRLKGEAYYQYLYDIPVESNERSVFSMVNVGADFYIPQFDSLVNEGLGRNYGLEVTLERFLDKGYYFLMNASLFKSEYQALDNTWRSTAFDMRFTINALAGYEHWFGQKVAVGFDAKLSFAGGKPYMPVDVDASLNTGEVVFDQARAFEPRFDEYFRTDLKLYYRINYKHVYTEFAMDLQNLTNHKNVFQREFNTNTGEFKTYYQMSFFPMFTFRCLF